MKKILLDGKEVDKLVHESLPMLIHGVEGSGASLYTICLAAKWFSQGYRILFLCGYIMAEQAFAKEVSINYDNVVTFYTLDKVNEFITGVKDNDLNNTIVIVKNVELFDQKIIHLITGIDNIIISGDLTKSNYLNELLKKTFTTEVYFSPIDGKKLPQLEKFQGVIVSDDYQGTTNLLP